MFKFLVILPIAVVACQGQTAKPVYCGKIPVNALSCIGNPEFLDNKLISQCSREEMRAECSRITCLLRNAGWLVAGSQEINKKKVEEYFDKFASERPGFSAAVQALKRTCLAGSLPPQGTDLHCTAYDLSHCIVVSFLKNAGTQWLQSESCQATKAQVEACPVCPEDCYAPAIPIGSCNACYATPPTSG